MDISNMKWKYLRENVTKYFDPKRHTPLCDYLAAIFPSETFVYDAAIPLDIIRSRKPDAEYKRYRPDARCENLSLIVEFDGVAHYQDQQVVLNDIQKDNYLANLGYKVVRIPYWIQLSNEMIKYFFDVDMPEEMCTLNKSFYSLDIESFDLNICPGNMSEAGRVRFIDELNSYPLAVQHDVMYDLLHCLNCRDRSIPADYIIPSGVSHKLDIPDMLKSVILEDTNCDIDARDNLLFGEPYDEFKYWPGGFRDLNVPVELFNHMVEEHDLHVTYHVTDITKCLPKELIDKSEWWVDLIALSILREDCKFSETDYHVILGGFCCEVLDDSHEAALKAECEKLDCEYESVHGWAWIHAK